MEVFNSETLWEVVLIHILNRKVLQEPSFHTDFFRHLKTEKKCLAERGNHSLNLQARGWLHNCIVINDDARSILIPALCLGFQKQRNRASVCVIPLSRKPDWWILYDVYRCGMDQELRCVKNHTRDQHMNTQSCCYSTNTLIFSSVM